ncbi:MAG: septum site-determining protein MinC [Rickettsiella sp.]|nr:septum site-determining protein MinC [Rickettsiella sp.]
MHSLMGTSQEAFKLKASLFTLTTFHLFNADPLLIQQQLKRLIEQTPQFFQQLPIILDLSSLKVDLKQLIDFPAIISCLRRYGLIPVGVRSGNAEQQTFATQAGLAILANIKPENTETHPKSLSPITAKLVTQPVRSGQQIYAKNSDLIVLTSVSPGAEILADGNIHIYGKLKGRALAGVTGNKNTHIFCKNLEAELIAIAGHYWLSEDLQDLQQTQGKGGGVHISLQKEQLQIKTLN